MVARRRLLLAAGAGALAAPLGAVAQAKVHRIGFLGSSSARAWEKRFDALRAGLRELGYVEGRNLVIESRWADGDYERLPALAAELARLKMDVIVTHGTPTSDAARRAAPATPIVFAQHGDPVATGLVASLARPGGNITGLTQASFEIFVKRLEVLREIVPAGKSFALLVNSANPAYRTLLKDVERAASAGKVELHRVGVSRPDELEAAFSAMAKKRVAGLIVADDGLLQSSARAIAALAERARLPSIGSIDYVHGGGLVAHSADFADMHRRAATYVDKILKGARPADLPIEQPVKFEMIVNLKTAKAIGISVPRAVLLRADRALE